MEVGRELDRLVAEKVMGWSVDASRIYCYPPGRIQCPDASRCPFIDRKPPAYSTDAGAAWEIVQKLVRDGFASDISEYRTGAVVGFAPPDKRDGPDCKYKYVHGSTISHAICLSALLAVGVDIGQV